MPVDVSATLFAVVDNEMVHVFFLMPPSGKYCLSIGLVLVLIGVVLTLMFAYCDDLYNPSACHTVRQLALEKYQLLKQRLSLKS